MKKLDEIRARFELFLNNQATAPILPDDCLYLLNRVKELEQKRECGDCKYLDARPDKDFYCAKFVRRDDE